MPDYTTDDHEDLTPQLHGLLEKIGNIFFFRFVPDLQKLTYIQNM